MTSRMNPSDNSGLRIIDNIGLLDEVHGDVAQEVEEAIKRYKKFHWGIEYNKAFEFNDIPSPKVVYALGEIVIIGYSCLKKGDDKPALYIHGFHNPPPILCADKSGQLFVIGGGYVVEPRGIVH